MIEGPANFIVLEKLDEGVMPQMTWGNAVTMCGMGLGVRMS